MSGVPFDDAGGAGRPDPADRYGHPAGRARRPAGDGLGSAAEARRAHPAGSARPPEDPGTADPDPHGQPPAGPAGPAGGPRSVRRRRCRTNRSGRPATHWTPRRP